MTTTPRSNPTISQTENVREATLDRPAAREADPLLKVAEIATRLRVAKMTVYRLFHAGQLPGAIRVGRSIRVPSSAVDAYLEGSVITP